MKNSKMIKVLSGCALTAMLMAGCAEEATVTKSEKPAAETKQTEEPKEVKEEKKAPKIGTRSNPVKFNEVANVETVIINDDLEEFGVKVDLSVSEVIRGDKAYQMIKQMNEFNDEAPEGYEWMLIKMKAKLVDSETEDYPFYTDADMHQVVSESGDVYNGDAYAYTEPDFSFEMYKGNEKEGYIDALVKIGEGAQLKYNKGVGDPIFFDLQ